MAVDTTLKGTAITNREATPPVLNNPGLGGGGVVKCAVGYLASVTASLSIGSIIRLVEIPSNAIVLRVEIQSAAQTAGAFDVGLYRNNKDGGAVLDADLYGSAVSAASALANTDVTNESTNNTIAKQNQPAWQAGGLSADPKATLDVALTVATTDVTTGAAAIGLRVWYTDGAN